LIYISNINSCQFNRYGDESPPGGSKSE